MIRYGGKESNFDFLSYNLFELLKFYTLSLNFKVYKALKKLVNMKTNVKNKQRDKQMNKQTFSRGL